MNFKVEPGIKFIYKETEEFTVEYYAGTQGYTTEKSWVLCDDWSCVSSDTGRSSYFSEDHIEELVKYPYIRDVEND